MTDAPLDPLDEWLTSLLGDERDVSLVAVGSLGRGDRAPHSDIDLLLLHRGRRDVAIVADLVWYPIWDRGLRLDHSVRTVKEAASAAEDDYKVALGLLDARHIAGDERLTRDLVTRVDSLWKKRAKRWIPMVRRAMDERHEHFGEVAYLLEPELKEGKGGLRDTAMLRALQRVTTILGDLLAGIDEPHDRLRAIRAAVHEHVGRSMDRLLLQDQDAIAGVLGFDDADALLAEVSASARAVSYITDECWRRIERLLGTRTNAPPDRPIGPALSIKDGEVHAHDATHWLAAAAAAAELRIRLSRATLQRFAAEVPEEAPKTWPYGWRQSFVALLGAGSSALPVLESLDHHNLIERALPEWNAVRHKPQRNPYHRFTVDRHLLEAVVQAAALTRRVARPDLLLLGAFLHDIGKGFPGDHTERGIEVVRRAAPRMGLPSEDVDVLVAMVRHHLLLPEVATRRDIDDPSTIAMVATAVENRTTLDLLHALTEADSLATGPSAWSDWKATLVSRLVERTAARFAGIPPPEPDVASLVPDDVDDGLHVIDGRCVVVAPDKPGLFSRVAGLLAIHGLDVLAATAGPAPRTTGRAVEVFDVQSTLDADVDWSRVQRDFDAAVDGALPLEERITERSRSYPRRHSALAAPPRVIVDLDASQRATVIEVRAPDDIGVLYRITKAIADSGLDVRTARASTLGHEVVDTFYVVDEAGRKLTDVGRLAQLEERILDALTGRADR